MRAAAITSFSIHVALLLLMFVLGANISRPAAPLVMQVSLIAAPAIAAPPPEEKRAPEPQAEALKPTDETGVKLAPPLPRRKPIEKPKPVEKEPEPAPTTTMLPAAPAGPSGLSAAVAVDAGNFEFTYYLLLVRNRVAESWSPPTGLVSSGSPVRAVVHFRIARQGEVFAVQLETASGVEFFDHSALRAVKLATPMPPLPLGYMGSDLGVHFGFDYSAP